jgi:hypothetical protein
MEAIESALKCAECKAFLECPIILPCSDSICKKHIKTDDDKEYHCLHCDATHVTPSSGFPENKSLRILLEAKIQQTIFGQQYKSASCSLQNLHKVIDDLRLFQTDPYYIVSKKINELKIETHIVRDQFKLSIDAKADTLIKELDEYEQECKRLVSSSDLLSKRLARLATDIDGLVKGELEKWHQSLNCFDSDEKEWRLIQEKSDRYRNQLEMDLGQFEDEFLLQKLSDYQLRVASFCKIQLESDRM